MRANVFRVEKLLFVPLTNKFSMNIPAQDKEYIDMIVRVVNEKSFYFSYNLDLTKTI